MSRKFHEEGCTCGSLSPVTLIVTHIVIVAYECPKCKKRTPVSEFLPKIAG